MKTITEKLRQTHDSASQAQVNEFLHKCFIELLEATANNQEDGFPNMPADVAKNVLVFIKAKRKGFEYMLVKLKENICGFTNEGNRVWETNVDGIYWIEGNFAGQFWYRSYAECHSWVKFFGMKTRKEHDKLMLVQRS
jgi:hypothetical protein